MNTDPSKKITTQDQLPATWECPICTDGNSDSEPNQFTTQKKVILLCENNHFFHSLCIADWLRKDSTCPTCRSSIDKDEKMRTAIVRKLNEDLDLTRELEIPEILRENGYETLENCSAVLDELQEIFENTRSTCPQFFEKKQEDGSDFPVSQIIRAFIQNMNNASDVDGQAFWSYLAAYSAVKYNDQDSIEQLLRRPESENQNNADVEMLKNFVLFLIVSENKQSILNFCITNNLIPEEAYCTAIITSLSCEQSACLSTLCTNISEKLWPFAMIAVLSDRVSDNNPSLQSLTAKEVSQETKDYLRKIVAEKENNRDHIRRLEQVLPDNTGPIFNALLHMYSSNLSEQPQS